MIVFLVLIVGAVVVFYKWMSSGYEYWSRRGIRQHPPSIFFGNFRSIYLGTESYGEFFDRIYRLYPGENCVGLYMMSKPQLLIRDANMAKEVETSFFSSFHDNAVDTPSDMFLASSPFFNKGNDWKRTRNTATRALTIGKIKIMVDHMQSVCKDLDEYVRDRQNSPINTKVLAELFTTDVVLGCVYGVLANSFKDPKQESRKLISSIFNQGLFSLQTFMFTAPKIAELLNLKFFKSDVKEFFEDIVKKTMKYRKESALERNDLLQQLLNQSGKDGEPAYTMDEILAISGVFVTDGFETSSLLMSLVMDFLSINHEVQEKLRKEIKLKIKSFEDITYENLHSLQYLDAIIKETLRLSPPISALVKTATDHVTVPCNGKYYAIERGTTVILPIYPLHKDPRYWKDPELFNPERFIENSNAAAYNPFGQGPRACLGNMFALTQVKACISTLVRNFEITATQKHSGKTVFDKRTFILHRPSRKICVKFIKKN